MGTANMAPSMRPVFSAAVAVFLVFILVPEGLCHSHSHDADPSFKYSKQANEEALHNHDAASEEDVHHHNHEPTHDHPKTHAEGKGRPVVDLWLMLEALGATGLVSIAPVFILYVIPINDATDPKHQSLLKVLLSFASGGLLGDAFLHLIPHAAMASAGGGDGDGAAHSHSHGHSHDGAGGHDISLGIWILAGIVSFLCVEKFVRLVKGDHGHSHGHRTPAPVDEKKKGDNTKEKKGKSGEGTESSEKSEESKKEPTDAAVPEEGPTKIRISAYLNLAADFAHNFTDGLAIGASFLAGRSVGIITTVTILLHEVPHEVGDFAILVQSGYSKSRAMKLQFSTAIGAMAGTVVSLLVQGVGEAATAWILPFTAGGFIYIATVSVIPDLLENTTFWQSVKEICALLVGIYMMVIIAELE